MRYEARITMLNGTTLTIDATSLEQVTKAVNDLDHSSVAKVCIHFKKVS